MQADTGVWGLEPQDAGGPGRRLGGTVPGCLRGGRARLTPRGPSFPGNAARGCRVTGKNHKPSRPRETGSAPTHPVAGAQGRQSCPSQAQKVLACGGFHHPATKTLTTRD